MSDECISIDTMVLSHLSLERYPIAEQEMPPSSIED